MVDAMIAEIKSMSAVDDLLMRKGIIFFVVFFLAMLGLNI